MKHLFLILILSSIIFSCKSTKKSVTRRPIVNLENSSEVIPTEAAKPLQPERLVRLESREEGIGLGSVGSIGHGSVHYEERQPTKIIHIKNTSVSTTSTNMGQVVYKIPTEMKVRNTYQVIVRISKSTATIYENLNGEVRTSTIPITEKMEVTLVDPSPKDHKAFDVIENNKSEQIIENDITYTEWRWDVTPLRSGKSKLKVVVSKITNNGTKQSVYEDVVNVEVDIWKQIGFFFKKYWQWLISTIVIPFGVWLYNRKKKAKN